MCREIECVVPLCPDHIGERSVACHIRTDFSGKNQLTAWFTLFQPIPSPSELTNVRSWFVRSPSHRVQLSKWQKRLKMLHSLLVFTDWNATLMTAVMMTTCCTRWHGRATQNVLIMWLTKLQSGAHFERRENHTLRFEPKQPSERTLVRICRVVRTKN